MMKRSILGCACSLLAMAATAQTRVSGTIRDAQAEPLPDAQVLVGDPARRTVTDEAGVFTVEGDWSGEVRVRVEHVSFVVLDTLVQVVPGANVLFLRMPGQARMLDYVHVVPIQPGRRAPFAKSTMTKEEIAKANTGVDLPYLLDLQPSTVTTSDGGTGIGYTYMRIRGTDGTRTNVTVNGVPFNDAESQGAFFVDLPDLASSAESIEIQRGVGTSTNGAAAFGASVNVRTSAVRREAWGQLTAGGGSFNTQRYAVSAGTGLIQDKFSLDMRLSSISSDGYIDRATADLKSYFAQAAWVGERRSLRFITFRGKERTYQAWDGVPREVIDTNRTYNGFTYDNQVDDFDQANYQLLFDQKVGANTTFNVTLFRVVGQGFFEQFRADDDLATYGIAPAVIDGDTITTTDVIRRRWLDNTLTGANVGLETRLGRHTLTFGGSYGDYRCAHFGEVLWARYAGDRDIRDRYYDNDSKKTDANAFVKLNYMLTERIDLYGDMQVRNVDYDYFGLNADMAPAMQRLQWTFLNPKAGVLWRINDDARAYASFAVANREPNRDDVEETTPESRPGSERLYDLELGYQYNAKRWRAGVNAYYMDYIDQLVLTGELNDVGAALRTNVPSSYRAGLELTATVQPVRRLTWRMNATVSRNQVRDLTEFVDDWDNGGQVAVHYDESDLAFSPALTGASELGYRFWDGTKGNAELTFITKYVGEQYLDNSASTERMLDAYLVNDLRLNASLIALKGLKGVDLNITVRNLFSELYESNGWVYSYVSEGRRQEMVGLFPQAPLNVLGGVTVRF